MNKNILKYIVPIIAVLVVVESVILIARLTGNNTADNQTVQTKVTEPTANVPDQVSKNLGQPVFEVVIDTPISTWKAGEAQKVVIKLNSLEERALDALSVFVKYDSGKFEVDNITYDVKLPKPITLKASAKTNLVVGNFMVAESGGLKLSKGDSLALLQFDIVPKEAGEFTFELSTSQDSKESATMFVETMTSKELAYSGNKLTVSVTQ
jgi:hypothetical protein